MSIENLLYSRAYNLNENHIKVKYFYTYHIYILWHLTIWLVITRFLCLMLLQEKFKLGSIFLNRAFGTKEDIAYSLINSRITTLCYRSMVLALCNYSKGSKIHGFSYKQLSNIHTTIEFWKIYTERGSSLAWMAKLPKISSLRYHYIYNYITNSSYLD